MHYLEVDYRASSLNMVIKGLSGSIKEFKTFGEKNQWYDALFFLEDSEHIFGLAFIAFQNYINASIKDLTEKGGRDLQQEHYKHGDVLSSTGCTNIELIICLANYIKHKGDDNNEFHKNTKRVLAQFNLNTDKHCDITESAVFGGLDILDEKWDLTAIKDSVLRWRKSVAAQILGGDASGLS